MSHDKDLLHQLFQHPGFKVLEARIEERKRDEAGGLARSILSSNKPLDHIYIATKRGFWQGADWFIQETKRDAKAFAREGGE